MVNILQAVILAFIASGTFLAGKWFRFYGYFSAGKVASRLNSSYDYVVVGGGSAGAVVAARLSENPSISVLLLEAGGEETDNPTYHIPAFMFTHLFTGIDWMYQTVNQDRAQPNRRTGNEEFWGAGRLLGGGSIINYLQYVRGSKHDYDAWERAGCTGWGYKDVLPYFLKSEDIQVEDLKDSKYHSTGGFLGVSDSADHPLHADFISAGRELGYDNVDCNGEKELGFSSHFWNVKNGVRSSPARDLLRDAMARDNLHVSVRSLVTKVIIEDKRAVGVEFIKNNIKTTVKANKEVILSAGALGSPKILLLSGIGPKKDLTEVGIPVVADLPVGQNLQYHYLVHFWVDTNSTQLIAGAPSTKDFLQYLAFDSGPLASQFNAGVAFLRRDNDSDAPAEFEIQLINAKVPTALTGLEELKPIETVPGFTFAMFHLHPKSTGLMKLKSWDPFDSAIFDPKYFTDNTDVKEIIEGVRILQKLIPTKSMKKHNIRLAFDNIAPCHHTTFDSDEFWDCYIRNVVICGHHSSTCKMGDVRDTRTVIGPDLKVKGIKGLRVMDASVLPTAVSGNTNAPCIMIGEKGADMILKDLLKSGNN